MGNRLQIVATQPPPHPRASAQIQPARIATRDKPQSRLDLNFSNAWPSVYIIAGFKLDTMRNTIIQKVAISPCFLTSLKGSKSLLVHSSCRAFIWKGILRRLTRFRIRPASVWTLAELSHPHHWGQNLEQVGPVCAQTLLTAMLTDSYSSAAQSDRANGVRLSPPDYYCMKEIEKICETDAWRASRCP